MLGRAMIRRLVALVLVLAAAAVLLIAVWPQALDLQRSWPAAQAVSFRVVGAGVAVVVAVVLLVIGLFARRIRSVTASVAVLALVAAAVSAGVLASRGIGRDDFTDALDTDVTVLSWNTLGGAPGAPTVAELAVEVGADVVALPETDAETAKAISDAMNAAGLPMAWFTSSYDDVPTAKPTSLLVSTALGEYTVATEDDGTSVTTTPGMPSIIATPVDEASPVIVAAHPVAPLREAMEPWRAGLDVLADACASGNVVMAGDFNATIDHMAGLGTAGGALGTCRDAAVGTANGGVGTWPTDLSPLLGTPIDHVLASRHWLATGFRVVTDLDEAGSDHRPVVAQLSRTGA
ncbi:hypothetical protein ASF17_01425 [Frigoribacterium sp. Leaf263]|nr:hypothetical protein ASF17_01425 [Frigoribacterium sp. Leaf263]